MQTSSESTNPMALRVEKLSKVYRIAAIQKRHDTLRDQLTHGVLANFRRLGSILGSRSLAKNQDEHLWALKDVSFEVKKGEVIGVIGRNGAGKSTLLKILSRVTKPTEGRAEINGRVGSLLEVGTGFHPELTGRENIYLNGAILGMKRAEIQRQFDEIVAFAEVQRFLDTPVKRYSSGMYLRLAFAVAAHLEPEILLVDEVLAVGDWDFQKKCLGKIGDVGREGRTVLLVSHNMASVLNFCRRAILLDSGKVIVVGPASSVVHQYLTTRLQSGAEVVWKDPAKAPGNEKVRLYAVRILAETGVPTTHLDIGKEIQIEILFWNLQPGGKLYPGIHLKDEMGIFVLASPNLPSASLTVDEWSGKPLPAGLFRSVCRIPGNLLNSRTYILDAIVTERVGWFGGAYAEGILTFEVFDSGGMRKENLRDWDGVVRPRLSWYTEYQGVVDEETRFCSGS